MTKIGDRLRFLVRGLIMISAVGLCYIATYSSSYHACQRERSQEFAGKSHLDLSKDVVSFVVCESVTIDANGSMLTAIATIFMAWFTGTLWTLNKSEYNLSHRAKLRVRSAGRSLPMSDQNYIVPVHATNVGDTAATIVGLIGNVGWRLPSREWAQVLRLTSQELPVIRRPRGGESFQFAIRSHAPLDGIRIAAAYNFDYGETFCLVGAITYLDAANVTRRTGFYFAYDFRNDRWLKPNLPDEEFQFED